MQKTLRLSLMGALALVASQAFAADEAEVRALHERTGGMVSVQRMVEFSRLFQGTPYKDGPLGEGPGGKYDQDPLHRFDAFDCTTFVETVVSLSRTVSWEGFQEHLRMIRYDRGKIGFTTRNHFAELDWNRNNERDNGFADLTERVAPGHVLFAEALIDKPGWYSKLPIERIQVPGATAERRAALLAELRAEGSAFQAELSRIPYIPIDWLFSLSDAERARVLQEIPSGTVVNIVRPNWDLTAAGGTHMNISHQGLLFFDWVAGKVFMHHASLATQQVVAVPLEDYLRPYIGHATGKGINLVRPGW
jgi:hypothetical protein